MTPLLALVKKDVRRFWPAALLLAATVLLQAAIGLALLHHGGAFGEVPFFRLIGIVNMLELVQAIATALLTVAIIQEDNLVGTERFWMTRPIPGGRLLIAKGVCVTFFTVAVPGTVALPWWLAAGFDGAGVLASACDLALDQAMIVALVGPFAAITSNLGRFLLAALGALLAFVVIGTGVSWLPSWTPTDDRSLDYRSSRELIAGIAALATSVVVIVSQYLRRNVTRASATLVAGSLVAIVAHLWWPVPLFRIERYVRSETETTRNIEAFPAAARIAENRLTRSRTYALTVGLTNVPPMHSVTGYAEPLLPVRHGDRQSVFPIGGPVIELDGPPPESLFFPDELPSGRGIASSTPTRWLDVLSHTLPATPAGDGRSVPPPAAHLRLILVELLPMGSLSLGDQGILRKHGRMVRLARHASEHLEFTVTLVETHPRASGRPRFFSTTKAVRFPVAPHLSFVTLIDANDGRQEADTSPENHRQSLQSASILGVGLTWRKLGFDETPVSLQGDGALPSPAQDRLDVAVPREAARFDRTIVAPAMLPSAPTR